MILIGQYDSPFVRRVGIALTLLDLPFEHRPWSVFGDAERIRPLNPLVRVPTMVLDDGFVLVDSASMIDHIDGLAPPGARLLPVTEPARRHAVRIGALATGMGDKAASLFYEQRMHTDVSDAWVQRCSNQISGVLAVLEAERRDRDTPYWFGDRIGHADIAVACVLRFVVDVHPALFQSQDHPALSAFCAAMEALPVFRTISQPFVPPT